MKIAVYGGSFNPPHLGHREAAEAVVREIAPDKLLIIPDCIPPHKEMAPNSPGPRERLALCRLNFAGIERVEVSDMEILREGRSFTADTVARLREEYPGDSISLVIGTDMLLSFEQWHDFSYLFSRCELIVMPREEDDRPAVEEKKAEFEKKYGAKIRILESIPLPMSSSAIRELLPKRMGTDKLYPEVYAEIIKQNYYGALPELSWLREQVMPYLSEKRIAHVAGCEGEAVLLAMRYGADADTAAEAAILHDITKKLSYEEHLQLCEKYGIICDKSQLENEKLLHAITGAALARDLFGVSDEVYSAIRYHTTGRPAMTLPEKIIYLADYIEPTRDFEGVELLRELAYEDLDKTMLTALLMSLQEVRSYGVEPHEDTQNAYDWFENQFGGI